jgi:cyclopropane-fatty-acyl-phospholipid synthase
MRSGTAARLLRRVFSRLDASVAFRLWDGTTARVGRVGEPGFTIVLGSPHVFRRLLRRPTPLRFGEAYIDGQLDIEGDLFAALSTADAIEQLHVPLATRVAVLANLLRP